MSHACYSLPMPSGMTESLFNSSIDMIEQYTYLLFNYNNSYGGKVGMAPILTSVLDVMTAVRLPDGKCVRCGCCLGCICVWAWSSRT